MKLKGTWTIGKTKGCDTGCLLWHGSQLYSGNDSGIIKVWSPENEGKLIAQVKAHDGYPIYHMVSDVKNNQILTCSSDMKINNWVLSKGELSLVRSLEGQHKDAIRKLCICENYLYSGDETGEVIIWDKNGRLVSQVSVLEEIWDLAVHNNALFTVRDRHVLISEFRKKDDKVNISTKMTLEGRSPLFVNDDYICFVDRGGMDIIVHKNQAGFPQAGKLQGHSMVVNAITVSGNILCSGGWDKKIIAWDLNQLSSVGEVQLNHYINALTTDSCSKLFVAGQEGVISFIDLKL